MPAPTRTRSSESDASRVPMWLVVGTALAMLMLIGGIGLDFFNIARVTQDNQQVSHTRQVMAAIEQVLSLAKDAETGQRGYIITGQEPYLAPYDAAVREIDQQITAIQRLTADDSSQQARLPEVRAIVADRIAILADGITRRKNGDLQGAQDLILSGKGKRQMDQLRTVLGEMIQHERNLLAEREDRARRMQTIAVATGVGSGLLTLCMIALLLAALRKHLVARAEAAFAIAEQGERWRTTLASIGDGVITTDVNGDVTHMNPVAEALTGWQVGDAVGQRLTDVFNIVNEATRQPVTNPAVRALEEGIIVGLANHTVLIARDGVERPIDDSAAPIRCKDGEIVGCVLVFRDVTERSKADHALRRSEQRLRAVYDGTSEFIGLLAPDGTLLEANRASLAFVGGQREGVVGKPFWETPWFTFTPGAPQRIRRAVEAAADGEIDLFELHLTSPAGERRWFEVSLCPIFDDQQRVVLIVPESRDITSRKAAEQAQAQLATIVSSSDDAIISKDLTGRITSWNRGAERIFGFTAQEAIGQSINMLIPPELQAEETKILARLARGEYIDHFETTRIRKGGARVQLSLSVSPLKDANGTVIGASKIARDISAAKHLEEQLRRSEALYRRIGESIDYGVWICGADGRNTYVSESFLKLVGMTQQQAANFGWADVLHPDDADETIAAWKECVRTGRLWDREHRFRGVDGRWHHVLARGVPVRNTEGEIDCWAGINLDISRIKNAEEELRRSEERFRLAADAASALIYDVELESGQANHVYGLEQIIGFDPDHITLTSHWWHSRIHPDDLSDHLLKIQQALAGEDRYRDEYRIQHARGEWIYVEDAGQIVRDETGRSLRLTGSILDITERKRAEEALREADRRKDEFLAMLAHELRNPLAPIRNALQIFKLADGPEQTEQAHDVMERQFNQLVRLVDDLLDVSRINLGKIDLRREQVELKAIVQQAVETSRPAVEEAQHDLRVSLPPQPIYVNGDPQRLSQVFSNLLNNSCKYSPPRGKIWLSVERRNEIVAVTVKDSGVGIAPEKLPHIFEIFTQVDSSLERSQGGLGVGLALVQRLVEMHGGSVTAMSDGLGKGSEFVVRLPIAVDAAAKPAPMKHQAKSDAKHRILVVDDNRDSAKTMAMMLKLLGHTTELAHDGEEAIGVAENFRPNVVLLDIGLPKINGFEVARRIRGQSWGREMFLAAMTGWGQDEDRRKSQEAGFDTHLVKPVDLATLTKLLAQQPTTMKAI